jgi:hypothetical protein
MTRSLLLEGILAENPEAARGQVWTFDHATVLGETGRHLLRLAEHASQQLPLVEPLLGRLSGSFSKRVPSDPVRHARDDDLILPIEPESWRAAKLGRILRHLELRLTAAPSAAELLDLCLEAERRAAALLTRLTGPGRLKAGLLARFTRPDRPKRLIDPFHGHSAIELARYVLRRTFEELDETFASKPREERERIAADIARLLADLPAELQDRIRKQAGLADLSVTALKRAGAIAAVGSALAGSVGIAGFAAYTTFTSTIASMVGLLGLTLPFAVYVHATAALAFLSNPLVTGAVILAGGHFGLARANRQIQDRLVPIMVATAVMASTTDEIARHASSDLVDEMARYCEIRLTADASVRRQIDNTFQCLPKFA